MTVLDYILDGLEAELALERELGVRTVACDRALLAAVDEAAGGESSTCGHAGRVTLPNGGVSREDASARSARRADPTAVPPASNQTISTLQSNDRLSAVSTLQSSNRQSAISTLQSSNRQSPISTLQSSNLQSPVSTLKSNTLKSNNLQSAPGAASYDFVFVHHKALSAAGGEMMGKIVAAMGKTPETAPIVVAPPVPKAKAVVVLGGLALKKFYPALKGGPGDWREAEAGERVLITFSPEYVLRYKSVTSGVMEIKRKMWADMKSVMQRTKG